MSPSIEFETASIEAIAIELGRRLEAARLAANVSQAALAAEAGVSRRTITRLENGSSVSLDTLLRVMRALGLSHRLAGLLPDPSVRPIDRVRLQGHQRQRASSTDPGPPEWSWGDEQSDSDENTP